MGCHEKILVEVLESDVGVDDFWGALHIFPWDEDCKPPSGCRKKLLNYPEALNEKDTPVGGGTYEPFEYDYTGAQRWYVTYTVEDAPDTPLPNCKEDKCMEAGPPNEETDCGWGDASFWLEGDTEGNQLTRKGKGTGCTHCEGLRCVYKKPVNAGCGHDNDCMTDECVDGKCVYA